MVGNKSNLTGQSKKAKGKFLPFAQTVDKVALVRWNQSHFSLID